MVTAHGAEELGLCPYGLACQAGENGFDLAGVTFARGRIYAGGIIRQPGQRSRGWLRTGLYMQNVGFLPRRPVPAENLKKKKPLIQYQLCILTFSVYMCIQRIEKFLLFESMFQP